jgi:hypothetical protein
MLLRRIYCALHSNPEERDIKRQRGYRYLKQQIHPPFQTIRSINQTIRIFPNQTISKPSQEPTKEIVMRNNGDSLMIPIQNS